MLKDYLSKLIAFTLCLLATNYVVAQSSLSIDGGNTYATSVAFFSNNSFGVNAEIVLVDDGDDQGGTTSVNDGCEPIVNDVSGKIALIDRGACAFAQKALSASDAGAVGVVVCNNVAGDPFMMLGNGDGIFDLPVLNLDSTNCAEVKMALGVGTVTGTMNGPNANETVASATLLTQGTHTADAMDAGFGTVFNGATHGLWYRYVTAGESVLTITTCNGDATGTRLIVMPGSTGGEASDAILGGAFLFSQGACGNGEGSEVSFIVGAGESYYIHWDDANGGAGGFDFDINESAIPMVDVTVSVDMQDVTVAPEGAYIAGEFNGFTGEAMTDNGDGTYSYSFMWMAGTPVQYKFQNGPGVWEDSGDLAACGVDDGFGGFNRIATPGLSGEVIPVVCFTSCDACPPDVACPNWIQDDFESYALGTIGDQNANDPWTTWSNDPGGAEDAVVIDAGSFSGAQALQISADDPDDLLLLLGDRTSGNFILKWKMYVPTGSGGYYNLQKVEGDPGNEFANEVVFNVDGTGEYNIGGGVAAFDYPHDTWFEVYHNVDLDNNLNRVWINGAAVSEHPANWQAGSEDGVLQLGAVDFFGFATVSSLYWVDDVLLKQIEACPANAIICDGFDGYDLGTAGNQSPWWSTWTFSPGGADDIDVTNAQQNSCEQSAVISADDPDDALLLLGDRTEGNYELTWDIYVPTGSLFYYNTQKFQNNPGGEFGIQIESFADGTATLDAGAADVATFNYPNDEWFTVQHFFDLDNDLASMYVNGDLVYEWPASAETFALDGTKQLGAIDFFGNTDNLYYIDNVRFVQLPSLVGNICGGAIDLNPYTGGGVGTTVSTPLYNNTGFSTEASDPMTGWECFGEPDGGGAAPELNNTMWFTFEGDGETYFIETGDCGAADYIDDGDTQMAIFSGTGCGDLTPVDCNEDSDNAVAGNYISGLELATEAGVTYYMMIDGFNLDLGGDPVLSDGEFCINFTQLTGTETVAVSFGVDLTGYLAAGGTLETVKIAGNFADNGAIGVPNWDPPSSPTFADQGMDVWTATIEFDVASAGGNLEFKFLNTADTWGDCGIQQECMEDGPDDACKNPGNDNRLLVIPAEDAELCFTWETCFLCNEEVATREQLIDIPMTIAPNPFSQEAIVTFANPMVDANARLTTVTGQVARTYQVNGTQLIIEKENLNPGVYFFTVVTNDGVSTAQKLIVQ